MYYPPRMTARSWWRPQRSPRPGRSTCRRRHRTAGPVPAAAGCGGGSRVGCSLGGGGRGSIGGREPGPAASWAAASAWAAAAWAAAAAAACAAALGGCRGRRIDCADRGITDRGATGHRRGGRRRRRRRARRWEWIDLVAALEAASTPVSVGAAEELTTAAGLLLIRRRARGPAGQEPDHADQDGNRKHHDGHPTDPVHLRIERANGVHHGSDGSLGASLFLGATPRGAL